ncbi:MAG: beta-propeller fold lactonase family protein [Parafilimonas sp.]
MLTKKVMNVVAAAVAFAAVTLVSCNKDLNHSANPAVTAQSSADLKTMMAENGNNPDEASITAMQSSNAINDGMDHFLYTEDNNAGTNGIMMYKINTDGSLDLMGTTASGGVGTGAGLGSQGAVIISADNSWLFAVNAGSNSVSSFKINSDGTLMLAGTAATHGMKPVSVAAKSNMLYVLNTGSDNICGLWIGNDGTLTDIANSMQSLSATAVDAPQIAFSPVGNQVIVTEKATNTISTFKINSDGSANAGIFTPSVGATPFGFAFARDKYMIVSNAAGGAAGQGSATSYTVSNSMLYDVNGAIADYQAAPCWFAVAKYGRFAYTTNTASNSISSYYISDAGALYLAQSTAGTTDAGPVDIVVAPNNYFVYELNGSGKSIGEYHRKFLGGLIIMGNQTGLPASATGLATF